MAIESQRTVIEKIERGISRARIVRERMAALKDARLQAETETAQRQIDLVQPNLSPLTKP